MLMYILSRILSAWFAFLLPCYSTWKALSHRPVSEPELERWSQYWAVLGAFLAVEYTLEWLVSWFPLYYEIKTLFLLFLSLPQTQGSAYIYAAFLAPYFTQNETSIDAGIERAKSDVFAFAQSRLSRLLDAVWALLASAAGQRGQNQQTQGQSQTPQQAASGPPANYMEMASGLWKTYGTSVLGALQRGQENAQTPGTPARPPFTPAASGLYTGTPQASSSSVNVRGYDASPLASPAVTPGGENGREKAPPPFPVPQPYAH